MPNMHHPPKNPISPKIRLATAVPEVGGPVT
jgi:hypothetical protein